MMFTTISAIALSALSLSSASPVSLEPRADASASYTLTFIGGPASYDLVVPRTNVTTYTNNGLGISQISGTGALDCTYDLWEGGVVTPNAAGGLDVGPPGPVKSVTCPSPADQCVGHWADCGVDSKGDGLAAGICCPGLVCMADRCRNFTLGPPWY